MNNFKIRMKQPKADEQQNKKIYSIFFVVLAGFNSNIRWYTFGWYLAFEIQ